MEPAAQVGCLYDKTSTPQYGIQTQIKKNNGPSGRGQMMTVKAKLLFAINHTDCMAWMEEEEAGDGDWDEGS